MGLLLHPKLSIAYVIRKILIDIILEDIEISLGLRSA